MLVITNRGINYTINYLFDISNAYFDITNAVDSCLRHC